MKLRHREAKYIAQGHAANKQQSRYWNSEPALFITTVFILTLFLQHKQSLLQVTVVSAGPAQPICG